MVHSNGSNGINRNGETPATVSPRFLSSRSSEEKSEERSLLDRKALLGALRRRWLLALTLGIIGGLGAAFAAWKFIPAPYSTFSEIRISSVQDRLLFKTAEERARFNTYKQTQMKLVKSPFVLNEALRQADMPNAQLFKDVEHPIDWLEENLSVRNDGTEFIRIALSGEHPQELATMVNAVTDAYLEEIVGGEKENRRNRLAQLEKIHRDAEEQLRMKRRTLQDLAESLQAPNATQADQKQKFLLDLHIQLRKELTHVHLELMQAKLSLSAREQGVKQEETEIPDYLIENRLAQHPQILEAQAHLKDLQKKLVEHQRVLRENHPRIGEVESDLQKAEQEVVQLKKALRPEIIDQIRAAQLAQNKATNAQLQEQIAFLEAEKKQLEEELEKIKIKEEETGILSFELEAIDQEIEQSEKIVQSVSSEIERLKIESQSPIGISKHRTAEVPYGRNKSKKIKGTGLAGLGVFAAIAAIVVWLEFLARRISSLDEVSEGLRMRIIGSVPKLPASVASNRGSSSSPKNVFWQNVLAESVDSTRTMLLRDARDNQVRTIMISSAVEGEGKTTLSSHLAISLARAGRRVLLVDTDLRKPTLHKIFDLPLSPGFCEVLCGEAQAQKAIQSTPTKNLHLLTAGSLNQKGLRALAQEEVNQLWDQLQEKYDLILIDSSPLLPITDSLILAEHVDGVILSVRRDVSRASKVAQVCQRLSMLKVPLLGTIVIGLENSSYGYRYSYGRNRPGRSLVLEKADNN